MTALWDRALAAEVETLRLEAIRDALLPQLMSGRIRVKDAERAVDEVL
jgi:type I restriction enzyme S subunit